MDIHSKGLIAVLTGNVIFGFSFLFSRLALNITIPSVLVAYRFLAAFLVMNSIVAAGRKKKKALEPGRFLTQYSPTKR